MTRVLVTGGTGQLATALDALGRVLGLDMRRAGRPGFDFDRPESIAATVAAHAPDVVINAAAYTAVDQAEADREAAFRANRDGPASLAALCRARGARLVHVSTDYVFDGQKGTPYRETDATAPTGVYGASKREGEISVQQALPDAVILRTSWVYAATGRNFVRTMLEAGRRRAMLRVVADQRGCPTLAADLAAAILRIVTAPSWQGGLFHACGSGEASWHDFACAIFDRAALHGLKRPDVQPIGTADWPTAARRPLNSRMNCALLQSTFGFTLPQWTDSLPSTVDAIMTATRGTGAPTA